MQLNAIFLSFVAAVVLAAAAAALRYLRPGYRARFIAGFGGWVVFAAALGVSGILANATLRPPAIVYVFIPTVALVAFLARSRAGAVIASSIPVAVLMGAESLRIIVELFLERLWHAGQLPRMLTFHGANFDILIGISAPVVAVLYVRHAIDTRAALIWNVVGIVSLANVVVRNVLISPAIHLISTEVPNAAIGSFPYSFIPTLIVPLALALHVLAIRSLSIIRNPVREPIDGPSSLAVGCIAS
jgi:hypothetical protein